MSNQPTQRVKGFNFEQPITPGAMGTVEFSRFLRDLVQVVNFGGRLAEPSAQTVSASPYTYTNNTGNDQSVIVSGGTVSKIEFTRNGGSPITIGAVAGMFQLSPLDSLTVTYNVVPTINTIVR